MQMFDTWRYLLCYSLCRNSERRHGLYQSGNNVFQTIEGQNIICQLDLHFQKKKQQCLQDSKRNMLKFR